MRRIRMSSGCLEPRRGGAEDGCGSTGEVDGEERQDARRELKGVVDERRARRARFNVSKLDWLLSGVLTRRRQGAGGGMAETLC